ncbi:hypothetical protein ABBQ38_001141 [Trebouxia sp. C0009 RCD-2024]
MAGGLPPVPACSPSTGASSNVPCDTDGNRSPPRLHSTLVESDQGRFHGRVDGTAAPRWNHTGATLRARFSPAAEQAKPLMSAWGNLTHTLSGLFCSSLNTMADASQVAVPLHAFDPVVPGDGSNWLFGNLPREAVCTENLTPWLKLLPCQDRQGLTQLMDRPTLYGASFHAMNVHLAVHTQKNNTCSPDSASGSSCPSGIHDAPSSSSQCKSSVVHDDASAAATLTQMLTLVLRPEQLHKADETTSSFTQLGKIVHRDVDLQRLFNAPGVAACSRADHTYIYFHLSRPLVSEAQLHSKATELQTVDNKLYSVAPTPDAIVRSASGVFAVWNVTAAHPAGRSEQCLQPSITWHQQPEQWKALNPPVQAQQYVAGRAGDSGTLVLQLHFNPAAKAKLASSSSPQQSDLPVDAETKQFCIFQMVPWYFRLLFHTMHLQVDGKVVYLDDVLLAHHLEPAEGPGTTGLIELCLSLPATTSSAVLRISFQKAFLTVFDHPPDAHRGFDIPAALLTFLDTSTEHQGPWNVTQQVKSDRSIPKLEDFHILHHLAHFKGQHLYTTGALVALPTPDFSMPYNVCCMTCTVLAIYILGVMSIVFEKPDSGVASTKAAKKKQVLKVVVLFVCFGSAAFAFDKSLQRQVEQMLVDLGLIQEQ